MWLSDADITRDIDRASNDLEFVRSVIADFRQISVAVGGLTFAPISVTTQRIV